MRTSRPWSTRSPRPRGLRWTSTGTRTAGLCTFGAATLTTNIRRLVLYEGWPAVDPDRCALSRDVEERLQALLAEGDREGVVETTFRDVVLAPEHEITALKGQPSWPSRVAAAHTVTRELRAMADARLDPAQAARITVPTLLLTGSESDDLSGADIAALTRALPDARVEVIDGQRHVADVMAPRDFARRLLRFLHEPEQPDEPERPPEIRRASTGISPSHPREAAD